MVSKPWLLIGDFNDIMLPSEVRGGIFYPNHSAHFLEMIDFCGLLDLSAVGNLFTWFRKDPAGFLIFKRLDRALAYSAWQILFLEAYVENLCRMH